MLAVGPLRGSAHPKPAAAVTSDRWSANEVVARGVPVHLDVDTLLVGPAECPLASRLVELGHDAVHTSSLPDGNREHGTPPELGTACDMAQMPREPSRVSRMMSAWPAWRAVSWIIWNMTYRTLHSMMSLRAHGLSRSIDATTARDCSICFW